MIATRFLLILAFPTTPFTRRPHSQCVQGAGMNMLVAPCLRAPTNTPPATLGPHALIMGPETGDYALRCITCRGKKIGSPMRPHSSVGACKATAFFALVRKQPYQSNRSLQVSLIYPAGNTFRSAPSRTGMIGGGRPSGARPITLAQARSGLITPPRARNPHPDAGYDPATTSELEWRQAPSETHPRY